MFSWRSDLMSSLRAIFFENFIFWFSKPTGICAIVIANVSVKSMAIMDVFMGYCIGLWILMKNGDNYYLLLI